MPNPIGLDVWGNAPAYVFKPIKAVSITAATPIAVWTPTTGKRFRLLGFCVLPTVANVGILFEDATGGSNEFLRFTHSRRFHRASAGEFRAVRLSFNNRKQCAFPRCND